MVAQKARQLARVIKKVPRILEHSVESCLKCAGIIGCCFEFYEYKLINIVLHEECCWDAHLCYLGVKPVGG